MRLPYLSTRPTTFSLSPLLAADKKEVEKTSKKTKADKKPKEKEKEDEDADEISDDSVADGSFSFDGSFSEASVSGGGESESAEGLC